MDRHITGVLFLPNPHDELALPYLPLLAVKINCVALFLLAKVNKPRWDILVIFRFDEVGYRDLRPLFGAYALDTNFQTGGACLRRSLFLFTICLSFLFNFERKRTKLLR